MFIVKEIKVDSGIQNLMRPKDAQNIDFDWKQLVDFVKTNPANYSSFYHTSLSWYTQFETQRDYDEENVQIDHKATIKYPDFETKKDVGLIVELRIDEFPKNGINKLTRKACGIIADATLDFDEHIIKMSNE